MKKLIILLFIAVFVNKPPLGRKINYDHPLGRKIEAAYMFNGKTGGIAYDLSLNKHHGTLTPATDTLNMRVTDDFGPCLNFDGTHSYVDTGSTFQSTFRNSFSISVWVKPTDGQPAASGYIFGATRGAELECVWIVIGNTGNLTFQYTTNSNRARLYGDAAAAVFSDGQETWHHIVMVVDSTIRAVGGVVGYFDSRRMTIGALSKGDTASVVSAEYTSTANPGLGAELVDGVPTNEYNGLIDNVIIYKRALTANEVHQLYRKKYCMIK